MQSLMRGLTKEMSKNFMIKVFADYHENHKEFDNKENFSIERVGGIKFLRKIRKAQLINEFIKENKIQGIIADHWKSLELIKTDKKKFCLIHGKEINHPKGSSLNKRLIKVLNNVEKVIANSEYTKNLAINNGVNRDKVIVINPGVGIVEELNKKSLEKVESLLKIKTPRLITVSRFDKRKNHEKVIMALRNLKQQYPDIVYICIGYGDEEENLKKLSNIKIGIVGMGGIGCPLSQYLVNSGIKELLIVDGDIVEKSNLNRQILFNLNDIGKKKVDVAKYKLKLINTECKINTICLLYTSDAADE